MTRTALEHRPGFNLGRRFDSEFGSNTRGTKLRLIGYWLSAIGYSRSVGYPRSVGRARSSSNATPSGDRNVPKAKPRFSVRRARQKRSAIPLLPVGIN